ncbi:MAG: hypothetical protein II213_02600, partial [Lachnospiraceae bacterium]|nr:hypothetical protein [Lachnospiraceae bacterium]
VSVSGFVGRPASAKKGLGNQYLFVNGRYFRSPYLHKAVMKAYEGFIPEGVTPSYFLYMAVDPQSVDVNIHPTKTEIKFEDDSVIFQIVYACIKEALGKNSFGSSIDFDREGVPDIPAFGKNFDEFRSVSEPLPDADPTFNPFDNDGFPSEQSPYTNSFSDAGSSFGGTGSGRQAFTQGDMPAMDLGFGGDWDTPAKSFQTSGHGYSAGHFMEKRDDYGKLFEDKLAPSKALLVLQGKYVLTSARSGLMMIHIRRAMERIMYDRFLQALSKNEPTT